MKKLSIQKRGRLEKLVAASGGFLILAGIVLLGAAILSASGFLNTGLLLEGEYLPNFAILMILVGLCDTFAAIIIARW